jgi:hypothetical protein
MTLRQSSRALALASFLCALSPGPAHGQSTAAAEALFNEGRHAMDAKDYDTACQRFRESNRLDPAVGTLLNLAVCETTRGRVATGWELFRAVSEKLSPDDQRHTFVNGQLAQIEPRLPHVTLTLAAGAPADTKAKEGEAEFAGAAFGVPLPMDPGKHSFVVTAPGREPRTVDVELTEGQQQSLEIAPGDPLPEAPAAETATVPSEPAPDRTPHEGHDTRTIGWIAGGVGVAGLAVGLTTGIMALGKKSITDQQCNDRLRVCTAEGRDAASSGRTLAIVSTVGWIVGALGVGAGAYFILTSSPKSHNETALVTDVVPGGAGLRVVHTW